MGIEIEKLKTAFARLAKKYPIRFAVLFGSAAKGDLYEKSDTDIAVYLARGEPLLSLRDLAYNDILGAVAKALCVAEEKIDLADLRRANILFRYEITSGGVLLYGNEEEYEEYRIFAFKDYIDSSRLQKLEERMIRRRQELLRAAT